MTPGQIFASGAEDAVDVCLHSSAFHSRRHVFASVKFHISPPSLVSILHSFFQTILRLSLKAQGEAKNLEVFFEKYLDIN